MVKLGSCHPAFTGMNDVLSKYPNIYGESVPQDLGKEKNRKADIVYFVGCVGLYREKESVMNVLALLDRLEVDYTLVDEVCCSGVLDDIGYQINEDLTRKNGEVILSTGAKMVITGCPYCFRTFNQKPQYALLKDHGVKVIHISQFLKDFDLGVTTNARVTYHDPCDLGRHCGIYEEPREIIRKIAPHFVEMRHNRVDALCCGAGGGLRGAFPSNSIAIARQRLEEVVECGADIVLTECNSCVHNLVNAKTRYSALRKKNFQIYNITVFINKLLEGG